MQFWWHTDTHGLAKSSMDKMGVAGGEA